MIINGVASGLLLQPQRRVTPRHAQDYDFAGTLLKTRPDKAHEPSAQAARRWEAEAAALGFDLTQVLTAAQQTARTVPAPSQPADAHVSARALLAAGRSRAVFSRAEVAGQVAAHLPTSGLSAAQVLARIEQLTDHALDLTEAVPVGAPQHGATPRLSDRRYATLEVLRAEQRILTLARSGRQQPVGVVDRATLIGVLESVQQTGVRLDDSQLSAAFALTGRGNGLDVLTAPAGAGKTALLGATALAWQQAGYRVVGLAPSARAAAELAAAISSSGPDTRTGNAAAAGPGRGGADTLAKWLHTRAAAPDIDQQPVRTSAAAGAADWARLDARTVLIVDEASMANTLDLDTLTQAANAAGTKVVLVGDPAQIGVINGPGGMLALLARQPAALALTEIHRFTEPWEKRASLALRDGNPDSLLPYQQAHRLHACSDGDTAADQLFQHWQQAIRAGQDALMLARTRQDVDALNTRARLSALADGHLTGTPITLGGREWQTGDLLRTRKNNRNLPIGNQQLRNGNEHVRNGDRWRVLGISPDGGLTVEDLGGRGRTTLPAAYVAKHAEYGWAATIDGSQGATCDLGLLLARPGLDREHLYVGLTRGRHGNHAYLTPDPISSENTDIPTPHEQRTDVEIDRACQDVLRASLAVSGAQDSALVALHRARTESARPGLARTTATDDEPTLTQTTGRGRDDVPASSDELAGARERVDQLTQQRQELLQAQQQLWQQRRDLTTQLSGLPRWAIGRRHALERDLLTNSAAQDELRPRGEQLDHLINTADAQLRGLEREQTDRLIERENTRHETARLGSLLSRPAPFRPDRDLNEREPARTRASELHEGLATCRGLGSRNRGGLDSPEPHEHRRDDDYGIGR